MNQNKNESINPILQHGRVADKNRGVVFSTSGFPYLTRYPRQCKWEVAATYLAIRIIKIENSWVWKSPAIEACTITRSNIKHCDQWEKIRTINLSYLSGAFPYQVN